MSGPKRADVQAALDMAARAAQASAQSLRGMQMSALTAWREKLSHVQEEMRHLANALVRKTEELDSTVSQLGGILSAREAVHTAAAGLAANERALSEIERATEVAAAAETAAQSAYSRAHAEYQKAEQSLRQAGGHYLQTQMGWAEHARQLFDDATKLSNEGAVALKRALTLAEAAARESEAGVARARQALEAADAALAAEAERVEAERRAARIREANRRRAALALANAQTGIEVLNLDDGRKFVPHVVEELIGSLRRAQGEYAKQNFEDVEKVLARVPHEVKVAARLIDERRHEWDLAHSEATTGLEGLDVLLASIDREFVEEWADNRSVVDSASEARECAESLIRAERFEEAISLAKKTATDLEIGIRTAAAAHGKNLERAEIGDAIMDVLEELGFDVSFEEGNRDTPLRISGQTAAPDGAGDFDIEVPLDGEVDFEVAAGAGDTSCVAAVEAVRTRLAERGVDWSVTDWGHARDVPVGSPARVVGEGPRTEVDARTRLRTHVQERGTLG